MNDTPTGAAMEPAETTEFGSATAARPSHSQRRHSEQASRTARRKRSQRLILAIALAVTLLLLIVVSIVSGIQIDRLSAENSALNTQLFEANQKLAKAMPELEAARKELADLTKGRLPHLRDLVPDKVLKIETGYVKNIVFTVLRQNGQNRYEYRVVMENTGDSLVRPDVRVFVFDHRGIQVGAGDISDRADMVPGESRSYSSVIDRFMDEEPRYFYVWMRGKKPAS
jgi:cell division protein FtsB